MCAPLLTLAQLLVSKIQETHGDEAVGTNDSNSSTRCARYFRGRRRRTAEDRKATLDISSAARPVRILRFPCRVGRLTATAQELVFQHGYCGLRLFASTPIELTKSKPIHACASVSGFCIQLRSARICTGLGRKQQARQLSKSSAGQRAAGRFSLGGKH